MKKIMCTIVLSLLTASAFADNHCLYTVSKTYSKYLSNTPAEATIEKSLATKGFTRVYGKTNAEYILELESYKDQDNYFASIPVTIMSMRLKRISEENYLAHVTHAGSGGVFLFIGKSAKAKRVLRSMVTQLPNCSQL